MSQTVDFATFCHAGDAHRLHQPGQLLRQLKSNNYLFQKVIVVYQNISPIDYTLSDFFNSEINNYCKTNLSVPILDIDKTLIDFGLALTGQYISEIDKAHHWKYHVVNHLAAIQNTYADYIVFADNDCWMVRQPADHSWIERGIELLRRHDCFIVSPNDGEPERRTQRMSQQMFLTRVNKFKYANFNQPSWDGNVHIPGGPMPEYWGMLEGRMELYCRAAGMYRYVLGPEYRYWHHNKLTSDGHFETDISKY